MFTPLDGEDVNGEALSPVTFAAPGKRHGLRARVRQNYDKIRTGMRVRLLVVVAVLAAFAYGLAELVKCSGDIPGTTPVEHGSKPVE